MIPALVAVDHRGPGLGDADSAGGGGAVGNPLGFRTGQARRPGTLLDFVCAEKEKYPDKVLLVRVGEFFEAFGVDALLLVEHCGLNGMGQKARAGCPRGNVQQTLDGLTGAGLTVAVYEEVEGAAAAPSAGFNHEKATSTARTKAKTKTKTKTAAGGGLKQRYLAQVVSPSAPTYIHGATLDPESIEFRDASVFVGVQVSARGSTASSTVSDTQQGSRAEGSLHYTVYEVSLESRFVRVSERLTEDAARCLVESSGAVGSASALENASVFFANAPGSAGVPGLAHGASGRAGGGDVSNTRGAAICAVPKRARRVVVPGQRIERLRRAEEDPRSFLQEMLAKIARDMAMPEVADPKAFRIVANMGGAGGGGMVSWQDAATGADALKHLRPRPLYAPTAQQLGLLPSPQVPDLVASLLPANDAPACSRSFLRRWLMRPPPPRVADEMQRLLRALQELNLGLPTIRSTLTTGKVVALCSSHQANAQMFRDLRRILDAAHTVLSLSSLHRSGHDLQQPQQDSVHDNLVGALVALVGNECGVNMMPELLRERCTAAGTRIDRSIVEERLGGRGMTAKQLEDAFWNRCLEQWAEPAQGCLSDHIGTEESECGGAQAATLTRRDFVFSSAHQSAFGHALLRKNELEFRTALKPDASDSVQRAFASVDQSRSALLEAVWEELAPRAILRDVKYDQLNNTVYLMRKPASLVEVETEAEGANDIEWVHPKDRNGRALSTRYTTPRVEAAMASYAGACDDARRAAREELRELCGDFVDGQLLLCAVAAIHLNEILLTGSLHTRESLRRGWALPLLESLDVEDNGEELMKKQYPPQQRLPITLALRGMWPYWLGGSAAVRNDVELSGQWIVTGPNMSGKSTLLRSITAVALLANCGLSVPATMSPPSTSTTSSLSSSSSPRTHAPIPRLDGYFLRTNGADCPAEGLSAFALEADDMRILLRDVTPRSLAAVDELGRGTAPREGAAIVGAVLEELDKRGCPSVFATHLQDELCALPLSLAQTQYKVLRVEEAGRGSRGDASPSQDLHYVYRLDDGICQDSFSLATALYHDVPKEVVHRAAELRRSRRADSAPATSVVHAGSAEATFENSLSTSDLERAVAIVSRLSPAIEYADVITLEPHFDPPPRLGAGAACVYLLEIHEGFSSDVPSYYIGETENLADRLKAHRQRFGADGVKMVVFPLSEGGRSEARSCEARGIVELQRSGFSLQNMAA
jgi:hypothetical protein